MESLTFLDIVKKLISSDEYDPDVQWCLSELRDILEIIGDMSSDRLRELREADRDGRCSISPKLACMDEVSTPTPEQYRWMMGRFLKGDQDG